MAISIISDLHITERIPDSLDLGVSFLQHPLLQKCSSVYLLGDIFDVMVGGHSAYLSIYKVFFDALETALRKGIVFHYFEGNHDFHLDLLLKKFIQERNLPEGLLHLHPNTHTETINGKKFFFSHGDDIEPGKKKYKAYRSFIKSPPLHFFANHIIPFPALDLLGKTASANSKKKNHNKYADQDFQKKTRDLFRGAARELAIREHYDVVATGHSHVQDIYSESGFTYLNVGYSFLKRNFLWGETGKFEFVSLSQ